MADVLVATFNVDADALAGPLRHGIWARGFIAMSPIRAGSPRRIGTSPGPTDWLGLRRHGWRNPGAGRTVADGRVRDQSRHLPQRRPDRVLVSIVGLYLWPWLADRFGRRNILALNIAVYSLAMPLVALSPTWVAFVAAYSIVRFALNGEWAVGSMLVAETWPARLRGLVLSFDRSAWGVGAALAGTIATFVVTVWGWRAAFVMPAVVALLAVYVRLLCPESPVLGAHAGPQAPHRGACGC